jgi:RNA polymerase sigma-70 factor (ECF subfamily)
MLGNRHDAEDATQDVFFTAFRKLAQFEQRSSFYTWLYRIAFNQAIDRQRRMGRNSRRFVGEESIALADNSEQTSSSPISISIANETVDQVRIALGRLDFDRRNIVILRDIECLDYSEIASMLALPIGTVRSRLHRARLELRDIMISMGMNQIVDFDLSVPNSTPPTSLDSQGLNKS